MENINNALYCAKKIVEESRHKFIHAYKNNRKLLIEQINSYPIKIDNKPSALYFKIDGLPEIDLKDLNKDAISIINSEYLSFSITSKLIKSVIDNNDMDRIKKVDETILNYANDCINKGSIDNLQTLFELLKETKEIYLDTYLKYMKQGILENPLEKTPFDFLELETFIHYTRKMLGKESHISLVLDNEKELSLESYKAINNLVGSRINGDISVNILTEPDTWKTYVDQQGQFIESTHDYENVEYDESSNEHLLKLRKQINNN